MAILGSLQFYQNKYSYPHYGSISAYGMSMECTPVGMNLRSGTLRVKGVMDDFMSCNYLSFTRDGRTLFAWIDDVSFRTKDSFDVSYNVDPWRTYKDKINLGVQHIERRPEPSTMKDPMLASDTDYPMVESFDLSLGDAGKRVLVVQVRTGTGEISSRTPVNPVPYQFWMREYDSNNWSDDASISQLMTTLAENSETQNIVTMYSIPFMNLESLGVDPTGLPVVTPSNTIHVPGFSFLGVEDPTPMLTHKTEIPFAGLGIDVDRLLRVDHSLQIVVPEAGILNVPDFCLAKNKIFLRRDVDLFSGACNYMLEDEYGEKFSESVRGSSVSSIPILSDPMDTYMSQNQNSLAVSMMGDIATIAGGALAFTPIGRAAGVAGGLAKAIAGGGVLSGINNIVSRRASIADATSSYSNPPAFLGTALSTAFNNTVWILLKKNAVINEDVVHPNFGYQWGVVGDLNFPSSGFIQTSGCAVSSTDGSVPRWALNEINALFDNGIRVH